MGILSLQKEVSPLFISLLARIKYMFKWISKCFIDLCSALYVILTVIYSPRDVDTKAKLLKMWKEDGNFLFSAFSKWLPQSTHSELRTVWPPVAVSK